MPHQDVKYPIGFFADHIRRAYSVVNIVSTTLSNSSNGSFAHSIPGRKCRGITAIESIIKRMMTPFITREEVVHGLCNAWLTKSLIEL